MRWVRTVVFPVPAPAMTSMGPVVCSKASFCCGSGVKSGFCFATAMGLG